VYVDPAWQGQRVGESLVDACVAQARAWHCDSLWLGVWKENARAIAFYRRLGFQEVGSQTFRIGNDIQNDLVMSRTLGT
jgi:ribosomal protein S18 acetylase RimI-like enzyme